MNAVTGTVPLLLVPGNLCDEQLFRYQVACFSRDRRVVVADITGSDSIRGIAAQVLEDAPDHFALAGLSMGGIIAFEIMRQAPARVERLALLDTNPGGELQRHRTTRLTTMQKIEDGGLTVLLELVEKSFFPRYVAVSRLHDKALMACILNMARKAGVQTFMNQSRALLERQDSWPTLRSITCPTLVLCGDQDALCSPAVHQEMADNISNARLEILKDCGHLSTLERPDEVNCLFDAWLNKEKTHDN